MVRIWTAGLLLSLSGVYARSAEPATEQLPEDDKWEVERSVSASPEGLLRGKVAGLQVAATDGNGLSATLFRIRGLNSVRGTSSPIWVVDGVILNPTTEVEEMFWQYGGVECTTPQNALLAIDPSDIERIEVLKNLSATAIYGAQGANGAIVITTRQANNESLTVSWSSNVSLVTPSGKRPDMIELGDYKRFQSALGHDVSALDGNVDWLDRTLENRFAHSHNISVREVRRRMSYYISGNLTQLAESFDRNDGLIGNARLNFDVNASDRFAFGSRIGFSYSSLGMVKGSNSIGATSTALAATLSAPARNAGFTVQDWIDGYDDDSRTYRVIPMAWFRFGIVRGLTLEAQMGIDFMDKDRYVWYGNGTPFGASVNGAGSYSSLQSMGYDFKPVLQYRFASSRHRLEVAGAVELQGLRNIYNTQNGTDFFDHKLRAKGINIAASKVDIHKFRVNNSQFGFYGTLAYDYDERYGVEVLFRGEKSRKYEADMTWYPSATLYWNLGNEAFLKGSAVSTLRLEAGYGEAGVQTVTPYEWYGRYATFLYPQFTDGGEMFHVGFFKSIGKEYNASLRLGLFDERLCIDVAYYDRTTDDRAMLLRHGSRNSETGRWRYADWSLLQCDGVTIANRGVEVSLGARIVERKDWHWQVDLNLTTNRNRVESISDRYELLEYEDDLNVVRVGSEAGSLYGYRCTGVVTQQTLSTAPRIEGRPARVGDLSYEDLNGDGRIDGEDRTVIGRATPTLYGGLNMELGWRRLTLGLDFEGAFGHDILNLDRMMQEDVSSTGNISRQAYAAAVATSDNPSPAFPCFGAAGTRMVSDRFVEHGDYLRMSGLTLAYRTPVEGLSFIRSLRVFVHLSNLFTCTSYKGWNPDVNCVTGTRSALGVAYGTMPLARTFTVGFNATF